MRLIDRDVIHWRSDENWELYATAADIRAIPIVDTVVVTRCKDCKHFNHKRMECENEAISTDHEGGAQYSLNFGPDDFCSYGEPKEG
nr:MAG TPA: hypothetical protein [Caudoviricetes sp.]